MQKFQCHMIVEAGKITSILPITNPHNPSTAARLMLVGHKDPVEVTGQYLRDNQPEVGGYYVQHISVGVEYTSYSSAAAFEAGYHPFTEVTDAQLTALTGEDILQYFSFAHLPAHLQTVSRDYAVQAAKIMQHPRCPERTVALRKLLECKDAAVRAALWKPVETP